MSSPIPSPPPLGPIRQRLEAVEADLTRAPSDPPPPSAEHRGKTWVLEGEGASPDLVLMCVKGEAGFRWVPLTDTQVDPPAGFGWDPKLDIRRTGLRSFRVGVDVSTFAPTGKTYYVGYPGASDGNDGLTKETSFARPNAALQLADARVVMLYPKLYHREVGILTVNSGSTQQVSIIGDGGMAVLGGHQNPPTLTWTNVAPGVYSTTRSAVESVWDAKFPDALGDYSPLAEVGSEAEVGTTPGSWHASGSTLFVHTQDGRAPDSDLRVYLTVGSTIRGGATVYLENIRFEGGLNLQIRNDGSVESMPHVYGKNVEFKYSYKNGLEVLGSFTHFQDCLFARARRDGANYHVYNGVLCRSIEVNCIGRDNGDGTRNTDNGSSTHDGQSIVRVGGEYMRNNGPNVVDVNGARAWNVGVHAAESLAPLPQGADFWIDGEAWLDGCVSGGSAVGLRVQLAGSAARLRHSSVGDVVVDPGATLETY